MHLHRRGHCARSSRLASSTMRLGRISPTCARSPPKSSACSGWSCAACGTRTSSASTKKKSRKPAACSTNINSRSPTSPARSSRSIGRVRPSRSTARPRVSTPTSRWLSRTKSSSAPSRWPKPSVRSACAASISGASTIKLPIVMPLTTSSAMLPPKPRRRESSSFWKMSPRVTPRPGPKARKF